MTIPFTQFLRPFGRPTPIEIDRPEEVEAKARAFIAAGGRFKAEHLVTGHVSLTACMEVNGEDGDVEIEVVSNGPEVPLAVDRLVQNSLRHIAAKDAP